MRIACSFIALCVAALTLGSAAAQQQYETYTGWAVPAAPVLPSAEAHPQLWFGDADLVALRAKWDDPAYADVVARVRSDISSYRNRNAASADPGDLSQIAKTLAFAWIIDGDIVARAKGYQALLLAYQNVPRTATAANFSGDNDEIYRATWLQNFAAAYDWLQPVLSAEDDATIRAALAEETALLADNMVSGVRYAPRPHNHRSKPAYAVGTAALTLSDDPRAAGWLTLALEQQNTTTRYQFSADGVYREGSHYWVYVMVNAVPFLWQYRHAGADLFPAYRPTFEWVVQTRTGRGWMPALEDGFPKPAPTHMVAAAYAGVPTALHSSAPLSEILAWNWATTDFFTDDYTGATRDVVWTIDEFLTVDAGIAATPPDASPTQRVESGQVMLRSDWNAGDADTRTLLFHGVASADNHDHPDLLSYALDAENTPLAVDPGYGPDGFSDDRRDWYTSARAHNVVTVNGFAPRDLSVNQNEGPEQTAFVDGPAFDVAEMFAPNDGVMGGATVRRGVAMLDDQFYAVYDHIEAANEASIQVHLHGRGAPDRDGARMTWTAPDDVSGDGGRLHAAFLADGPLVFDEADGWTSFYFSREEDQRWVAARRNASAATFLHTLVATDAAGVAPIVTDRTVGGLVSAELATADGAWHLVTTRDASTQSTDRAQTDGTFGAIGETDGAATRWGLVRGTTFGFDGINLMNASDPVTASADLRGGPEQTLVFEPSDAPVEVTVQLFPATATAQGVTVDGAAIGFEALASGRVRFTVPAGGASVIVQTDVMVSAEPPATMPALALSARPNPSSGAVTLALDLPVAGPVRVAVYDVLGRRVAGLADGVLPAGRHDLAWDGRAAGALVPAGVYIATVDAGGARVRTRLTRLR